MDRFCGPFCAYGGTRKVEYKNKKRKKKKTDVFLLFSSNLAEWCAACCTCYAVSFMTFGMVFTYQPNVLTPYDNSGSASPPSGGWLPISSEAGYAPTNRTTRTVCHGWRDASLESVATPCLHGQASKRIRDYVRPKRV